MMVRNRQLSGVLIAVLCLSRCYCQAQQNVKPWLRERRLEATVDATAAAAAVAVTTTTAATAAAVPAATTAAGAGTATTSTTDTTTVTTGDAAATTTAAATPATRTPADAATAAGTQLESPGTLLATTESAALPASSGTEAGAVQQAGTAVTGVTTGDSTAAQGQGQGQSNNDSAQQQQQQQQQQDPCPTARSCTDCRTAAMVASSMTEGYTCLWSEARSCLSAQAPAMPNMCAIEDEDYDSEGSSAGSMGSWMVLILLVAGLAYGRFKIMGAGSSFANFSSAASDFGSILNHSKTSNQRGGASEKHSET
jgi:hypothetical protein